MWLQLQRQGQLEEHYTKLASASKNFKNCCPWTGKDGEWVNTVVYITSITIPPKNTPAYLQASVNDGKNVFTVEFTGRKTLAGIKPGATIHLQGRISSDKIMRAPAYDLLVNE